MRNKLLDRVARCGSKVARAQMKLDLALAELQAARKDVLDMRPDGFYTVTLGRYGSPAKIPVIKAVRELTNMGLKEAKDMCDTTEIGQTPILAARVTLAEATRIKKRIAEAGGTVVVS